MGDGGVGSWNSRLIKGLSVQGFNGDRSSILGSPPPATYEQLFREYWGFTVNLVRKNGIYESSCEDVAQAILVRFVERDFLTVYNPQHVTERGGKRRFVTFKAFLSAFVLTYLRHHRGKQLLNLKREPLLCDESLDSGVSWIGVYGPETPDFADSVVEELAAFDRIMRVRSRMEELGAAEFFDLVQEIVETTGRVSVAALVRETGMPRTVVSSLLDVVREEMAQVA